MIKAKGKNTRSILGYHYGELKNRIQNHSNWKNVKNKKWHIDHVFPIKAFLDFGIKDMKIINALDNLQPLEASDNMKKNDKYNVNNFKQWLLNQGLRI
jgi:Uri superfamily endonuclease